MDAQTSRRTPVSPADRQTMVAVLIRHPRVFAAFCDELKPEDFAEADAPLALLWRVVLGFRRKYNKFPSQNKLLGSLSAYLEGNPGRLSEPQITDLQDAVNLAYDDEAWDSSLAKDEASADWAIDTIKQYMQDCLATRLQDSIRISGRVIEDYPEQLAKNQDRWYQIASIATDSGDDELLEKGWEESTGLSLSTTRIQFVDRLLGGGQAPGEAYGLMGPYGSCKTTIGVMLAVEMAYQAWFETQQPEWDGIPSYSFFFSYEAPKAEMRLRVLSYAARVARDSLQNIATQGFKKALSTRKGGLKDYEKKLFLDDSAYGEQGRCREVSKWINAHLRVIDMTGSNPLRRGAGGGGASEIAAIMRQKLDRGGKAKLVVVDYLGLMAKRHLAARNKDENALRHVISECVWSSRNDVAIAFGCPLWMIHQLSGKANSLPPGARLSHTDAAEARNFAENLDYCLIASSLNDEGIGQFMQTKHRRSKQELPCVIQVVGDLARVEDRSEDYVVNHATKSIVPKALAESAAGSLKQKNVAKGIASNAVVADPVEADDDAPDADELFDMADSIPDDDTAED